MNELHHKRKANGLVVLGVNWDELKAQKLTAVIARMRIEFPVLRDDPHLTYGYDRAEQLPVTILISPERKVHKVMLGPQTESSIHAAMM